MLEIIELKDTHKHFVNSLVTASWGSNILVTKGKVYKAHTLPGFIAMVDNIPQGLAIYAIENNECQIVSLDSLKEGIGIGSGLIKSVRKIAKDSKCNRLWLITTNDNTKALRFYQKRGFSLKALYANALEKSRKIKPEIPYLGIEGIPLRDEIELEMILSE